MESDVGPLQPTLDGKASPSDNGPLRSQNEVCSLVSLPNETVDGNTTEKTAQLAIYHRKRVQPLDIFITEHEQDGDDGSPLFSLRRQYASKSVEKQRPVTSEKKVVGPHDKVYELVNFCKCQLPFYLTDTFNVARDMTLSEAFAATREALGQLDTRALPTKDQPVLP